MAEHRLVAQVDEQEDGAFLVRAPAVGLVDRIPPLGRYLNPSEGFLSLRIMGRRHLVQLPRKVQGRVSERFLEGMSQPVQYNQPLFVIRSGLDPAAEAERQAGSGDAAGPGNDLLPIKAPSDGIFYRRPSPDSPAYVEQGSPVSQGTVLGLVEVMKSFNQITYGGAGLPEQGEVVAIEVEDSAEVGFGQTLFLIKAR